MTTGERDYDGVKTAAGFVLGTNVVTKETRAPVAEPRKLDGDKRACHTPSTPTPSAKQRPVSLGLHSLRGTHKILMAHLCVHSNLQTCSLFAHK